MLVNLWETVYYMCEYPGFVCLVWQTQNLIILDGIPHHQVANRLGSSLKIGWDHQTGKSSCLLFIKWMKKESYQAYKKNAIKCIKLITITNSKITYIHICNEIIKNILSII